MILATPWSDLTEIPHAHRYPCSACGASLAIEDLYHCGACAVQLCGDCIDPCGDGDWCEAHAHGCSSCGVRSDGMQACLHCPRDGEALS